MMKRLTPCIVSGCHLLIGNRMGGGYLKALTNFKNYISLYVRSFSLFWKSSRGSSSVLLFLVPIQALAPAVLIKIAQLMLDELLHGGVSGSLVIWWGIIFFIFSAAIPINTSLQGILTDKLIAFVNMQLMQKSKSINGLNLFENADFYDNLQLVSSEASWRPVNLIVFGISMLRELITVISMMALLARYNFWIAIILLLAIIPQSLVSYHIQQDSFETMVTRSPDARKIQYYSEALLTNKDAKEVRLFGMFDFFINAYKSVYKGMHAKMKKVRMKQMWISLAFLAISVILSIASLIWMVTVIRRGQVSAGGFLIFVSTLTATSSSVYAFIENSSLLYDTLLYMQKYFDFMHVKEASDYSGKLPFPDEVQTITYEGVSFRYPGQRIDALKDVSFNVHGGERIAIVGENGSGKSTLVKLLMRFYDPQQGKLTLNNMVITKLNISAYRKKLVQFFKTIQNFIYQLVSLLG